jgi:branched-chain amino acid transport system ATP-binding protein
MTALLEVRDLEVSYGHARALNGVTIAVARGSLTAVVGANGAGKTSLVRAIAGMLRPSRGEILFDGIDVTGLDTNATCELGIGQVAEGRQIFPSLTIDENLKLGSALRRASARRALNLERVFAERRRQKAGTLSGGEQQMLAIGRCLMGDPQFIMLDEPSLGLAPLIVELVFSAIVKLRNSGITILLIEQNVAESLVVADDAAVLENGAVVLAGPAATVLADEGVKRAYLGL